MSWGAGDTISSGLHEISLTITDTNEIMAESLPGTLSRQMMQLLCSCNDILISIHPIVLIMINYIYLRLISF